MFSLLKLPKVIRENIASLFRFLNKDLDLGLIGCQSDDCLMGTRVPGFNFILDNINTQKSVVASSKNIKCEIVQIRQAYQMRK